MMAMDKPTCWTCPKFDYSGELYFGDCRFRDEMVKMYDCCDGHPDYVHESIEIGDEYHG